MTPDQIARRTEIRRLYLELEGLSQVACHAPVYERLVLQIKTLSDAFRAHAAPEDFSRIAVQLGQAHGSKPPRPSGPPPGERQPGWGWPDPASGRRTGQARTHPTEAP
jgi:hypothetical protein